MDDNEKDFKNAEPGLLTLQSDKSGDFSKKMLKIPEDFSEPLLPQRYIKKQF